MIYKLQRKFILICTVSVLTVVLIVFSLITGFNISSMNRNLDILADSVSEGGRRFPDKFNQIPPPHSAEKHGDDRFGFITPETPFATRHFTVWFDTNGEISRVNVEFIHSVTENDARELADRVSSGNRNRWWVSNYRYKIFTENGEEGIVFIDGSTNLSSLWQSVSISAVVLLGCAALVILLVVLLSKRVVKPIAESYEKQRQFVTDANHELKTPLTLILANLDIAEAELGKNEWLSDIREEGERMTSLVGQLVALSRMDEEESNMQMSDLSLSDIVLDTVAAFRATIRDSGSLVKLDVDNEINCRGGEELIRRLVSVLLDNACKYCDTGGYGICLSMAKAIAEKHRADIIAYKKDDSHIGFRVIFKK